MKPAKSVNHVKEKNMSIDAQIASLIEALNANTEALKSFSGGTAAVTTEVKATTSKSKGKAAETKAEPKSTKTKEEVTESLTRLKNMFNEGATDEEQATALKAAKDIVSTVGGVEKMGDIPVEKYDAVHAAALAKYSELEATYLAKGETKAAAKPTKTQAEVNAALIKLKDTYSDAALAKDIIRNVGGVEKMGEIPPEKYDAVYEAAVAKFDELATKATESEDDL